MVVKVPIHHAKDHLSQLIADLATTSEEVHITKHGRVVARLVAPPALGVILGVGAASTAAVPSVEDLHWSEAELHGMLGAPVFPA